MLWLFKTMAETIRSTVFAVLSIIVGWFTELLDLDSDIFYSVFRIQSETETGNVVTISLLDFFYSNIILPLAISILFLNMIVQLYRGMFSKNSNGADEPIPLIIRSGIYYFFICYIRDILSLFDGIIMKVWKKLDYMTPFALLSQQAANNSLMDSGAEQFVSDSLISTLSSDILPLAAVVISIFVGIALGWRFLKLMFVYVTRFVEFQTLKLFAPLGMSGGGSSATKDMANRFFRMYLSSILSLLLSAMLTYLYCYSMAVTLSWSAGSIGKNVISLFITLSIYDVFLRLDSYLDKIGLYNASNIKGNMSLFAGGGRMVASGLLHGKGGMLGGFGRSGQGNGHGPAPVPGGNGGALLGSILNADGNRASGILKGRESKDAEKNTSAFAKSLFPQELNVNGRKATPDNTGIALMQTERDPLDKIPSGPVPVTNIGLDGDTGKWVNLADGKKIPEEVFEKMGTSLDENYNRVFAARIAKGDLNPSDFAHMSGALQKNSGQERDGRKGKERTAYGQFRGKDGTFPAEFTHNADGSWNTRVNGKIYDTPEDAAAALRAESVDIFKERPMELSAQKLHQFFVNGKFEDKYGSHSTLDENGQA